MKELRDAFLERLRGDARLKEINCAIYESAPRGTAMPYIDLGGETETDDGSDCVDALEVTMRVRVYARRADAETIKSCRRMTTAIRKALHEKEIAVSGHSLAEIRHVTTQHDLEYNDTNDTAVVMFVALIEVAQAA
jgi:hypothetical protein